jgi:hypothetical protein
MKAGAHMILNTSPPWAILRHLLLTGQEGTPRFPLLPCPQKGGWVIMWLWLLLSLCVHTVGWYCVQLCPDPAKILLPGVHYSWRTQGETTLTTAPPLGMHCQRGPRDELCPAPAKVPLFHRPYYQRSREKYHSPCCHCACIVASAALSPHSVSSHTTKRLRISTTDKMLWFTPGSILAHTTDWSEEKCFRPSALGAASARGSGQ